MYKNIRVAFSMLAMIGMSNFVAAQDRDSKGQQYLLKNHVNPRIKPLGELPPIASLTDGECLKGDLQYTPVIAAKAATILK